ncbi:MAG: hypothetical protein R3A50_03920 [Saprospiraceae bacterium]
MKFWTVLMLFLFSVSGIRSQDADKWVYKGEKSNIKIYHQETEGLLHIKLTMSVKVPLAGILSLFSDISTYPEWAYKLDHAYEVKRVSDMEWYYYAKYDFPWPLEDRDIILHSKASQNPSTKALTIVNTPQPDYLPVKKGVQRIRNTTTKWLFVPSNSGWVYVEQQISTDSAQGVPDWLVNLTADTGPRETAKGVRRVLSTDRFQNATLAHIRE